MSINSGVHVHIGLISYAGGKPGSEFWGHVVSTEREPITGGLGQTPSGVQSQSPWSRGSEAESFSLHLHYLQSWPICPKLRFLSEKQHKFRWTFGRRCPAGLARPLDQPVISYLRSDQRAYIKPVCLHLIKTRSEY